MHVVVLGAGLAGLAAAYELSRAGAQVTVLEREPRVGGLAASWQVEGHWLDHGPHRFYSRDPDLVAHLFEVLDGQVVTRERRSRIHLLGRYFDYPLRASNVLRNLPAGVLVRALTDWAATRVRERLRPTPDAHFEAWVVKRFGRTLYDLFFGTYTAKAWRMPCDRISADWASQRIAQADLWDTIVKTLLPPSDGDVRSLTTQFYYPATGGIGQIARRYAEKLRAAGGALHLDTTLERIDVERGRVVRVHARRAGTSEALDCDALISTIPWTHMLAGLSFADGRDLPREARSAMASLASIGIVFVYLEVARPNVMPDHWVYLPEDELTVHRVAEFKNFSDGSSPGDRTALCCEITCRPGDERWRLELPEAFEIARADLVRAGLLAPGEGRALDLARVSHAYPVYDLDYRARLQALRRATRPISNLITTGRQGLFRYNNMDHSMAMGRKAAGQVLRAERGARLPALLATRATVGAGREYFG